ncbi:hypothetical protein AMECASPLE_039729 [Ameca splendens]|uniref:Uncharacterized protein n=1 Tax=Ameca splendens TaxID=208324 RepID=A0ABV0YVM1_9TELE
MDNNPETPSSLDWKLLLRILSSWSLTCLCQGQMMASCLSQGGDSPQYRWSLDGHTLTDSELFSRNIENSIIVLRQCNGNSSLSVPKCVTF